MEEQTSMSAGVSGLGRLRDRTAVITGASSGAGRAIALALAAEGMGLCLVARNPDRLREIETAARQRGARQVLACPIDLAQDDAAGRVIDQAARCFACIDTLIHCAGTYARAPIEQADIADLDRQYRVNVRSAYLLTQLLLPPLRTARGDIVFLNSTQGLSAGHSVGQFAATQHALRAVADSVRSELNTDGVRVLALHLGRMATPRARKVFSAEGRAFQPELLLQPEDVATVIVTALRLPRTAEVTTVLMRPAIKSY